MMTHRNLVRDGMTLPLSEALQLHDDQGNKINFQLANNPLNGELPRWYYEDIESKKVYSLSIEAPNNLVTLKVADMTLEQKQQGQQQTQKKKSK